MPSSLATPKAMLRFVLRDGLAATEQDVRETIEADKDIDRNGAIAHGKVMARGIANRVRSTFRYTFSLKRT